jgi:hypothetical protein
MQCGIYVVKRALSAWEDMASWVRCLSETLFLNAWVLVCDSVVCAGDFLFTSSMDSNSEKILFEVLLIS